MLTHTKVLGGNPTYKVLYREIKFPRLEFKSGNLEVILPKGHRIEPEEVVERHKNWIRRRQLFIRDALKGSSSKSLHIERTVEDFKDLVRRIIERHTHRLRVSPRGIYFRPMRTKWASCSNKNNITFNTKLRLLPLSTIDYVVYHELIHLVNRKHDTRFWNTMRKRYRNTDTWEKRLLSYWFLIHRNRNRKGHLIAIH